nr:MAG TPA: hypothetical protein [Ackermannviridae sp.]
MEMTYASRGVANAGLATGIVGAALGTLNAVGGLGAMALNGGRVAECSENQTINRYELDLVRKNAKLESDIALRDANAYNDQKALEMYKYIDGRLRSIEEVQAAQAVHNQKTEDSFVLARQDIAAVRDSLTEKINLEAERRCCGDNSIVTYANATFYPKMVADVTTGTGTTAQTLYNPLPKCDKCCNGN